ncbi:DUF2231 domain-containing protein [Massilia sp. METH4]|uniref:DUF2231 domain-containing protein n=1 Tax=Massilia sp. METH4 TaxID=3123041 RepID=UPI0030CC404A
MSTPTTASPALRQPPAPLHAILLAGTVPLFLGALLSDLAYYETYHIQWSNFASWLIAGGLLFCGLALLYAVIHLIRATRTTGREPVQLLLLLATFVVGLINAFVHAKDAWAAMPAGLYLSIVVTVLACIAAWRGLDTRAGGAR